MMSHQFKEQIVNYALKVDKYTMHPKHHFRKIFSDKYVNERVVVDYQNKWITSWGPGTAIEACLKFIEVLDGAEFAKQIAKQLGASLKYFPDAYKSEL